MSTLLPYNFRYSTIKIDIVKKPDTLSLIINFIRAFTVKT